MCKLELDCKNQTMFVKKMEPPGNVGTYRKVRWVRVLSYRYRDGISEKETKKEYPLQRMINTKDLREDPNLNLDFVQYIHTDRQGRGKFWVWVVSIKLEWER